MNVSKYIAKVRNCHFTIEIYQGAVSEIDKGIALLKDISNRTCSNSSRAETEESIIELKLLKESRLKDIQKAKQDLGRFRMILESIPEGMIRTYLTDYVLNNMSDKELIDKYGYQEISSIHHLKQRAYKKLNGVLDQ